MITTNYIKKNKNKKRSKITFLLGLIFLMGFGFFYFSIFLKDKKNTNNLENIISTDINKIFIIQKKIKDNNDKIRLSLIKEIEKIEKIIKNDRNNLKELNNLKEVINDLNYNLEELKKRGINLDIKVDEIQIINYTNLINDLESIKNKLINNNYKKDINLNEFLKTYESNLEEKNEKKENKSKTNSSIKNSISTGDNLIESLGLTKEQLKLLETLGNN